MVNDPAALLAAAHSGLGRVLRLLTGRLYSTSEEEKWSAVRALGLLAGARDTVSEPRATELLRRFFWSMNDESGAVPHGIPEAIGEILAQRPELQERFLPNLCSLLTSEEMFQTGAIERGVVWALGRVGAPVAECAPEAVALLRVIAEGHADAATRDAAREALSRIAG